MKNHKSPSTAGREFVDAAHRSVLSSSSFVLPEREPDAPCTCHGIVWHWSRVCNARTTGQVRLRQTKKQRKRGFTKCLQISEASVTTPKGRLAHSNALRGLVERVRTTGTF